MKRLSFLILSTVLFAACKKTRIESPSPSKNNFAGKWNIVSVTTMLLDSTGKTLQGGNTYPNPAGNYFQFNNDGTWSEKLLGDDIADIGENGTYTINSDTSFTLVNSANGAIEPCKVSSLSPSLFVFSHERGTAVNGVTPAIIEYIFKLTK